MSEIIQDEAPEETPVTPAARRPWIHSVIYGVIILACGAAMGSVITAMVIERPAKHGPHRGGNLPEQIVQKMRQDYSLTPEQCQKLKGVFEEHVKSLSAVRSEVQPKMDAIHEALRNSVEGVLTPEQAARWREEYENMRRPWHQRDGGAPSATPPKP